MQSNPEEKSDQTEKSFADRIFFAVAMCLAIFIKPSQYMMERAYKDTDGGYFIRVLSIIASLIAAIAAGYFFGLNAGRAWGFTLTVGTASGAFVYYYGAPFFYCFLYDWITEAGKFFWKRVPAPGEQPNAYGVSPWFSNLLMKLSYLLIAGGSVALFLRLAGTLHTNMDPQSSFSSLVAWVVAGVISLLVTILAGVIAVRFMSAKMPGLAVISGALIGWGTSTVALERFSHFAVAGIDAFGFAIWVGVLFPWLHVFVSRRFQWLADWLKSLWIKWRDAVKRFYETVYVSPSPEFKGFFGQSISIVLSFAVLYLSGSYLLNAGYFGWWSAGAIALIAMLAMYLIGGALINILPNGAVIGVLSLIPSIWAGAQMSGFFKSVFAGTASELVLVGFVMPVVYHVTSWIVEKTIGHSAGATLLRVHKEMVENIGSSWKTTFADETIYAQQFAHFANLCAAAGGFIAMRAIMQLSAMTGIGGWLVTISATSALYLAGGKFLPAWGNAFLAGLCGFFVGLWCGVSAYQGGSLIVALLASLGGWLFVALLVYPLFYATTKSPFEAIGVSSWLFGRLKSIHGFFFAYIETFWMGVLKAYRAIQFNFRPAWQRVSRLWDDNWSRARDAINKALGG